MYSTTSLIVGVFSLLKVGFTGSSTKNISRNSFLLGSGYIIVHTFVTLLYYTFFIYVLPVNMDHISMSLF